MSCRQDRPGFARYSEMNWGSHLGTGLGNPVSRTGGGPQCGSCSSLHPTRRHRKHQALLSRTFHAFRLRTCVWLPALGLATGLSTPPAMRAEASFSPVIRELHLSPDGRYILAETDGEIDVLSVQPLAILFRIPAGNVRDAQFTADSQQIIFIRASSQVERWNIAGSTRATVENVPLNACSVERLSPDGRYVACAGPQGTLWLLDVRTGDVVLERKRWCTPGFYGESYSVGDYRPYTDASQARAEFSPDGRFFVAAPGLSIVWTGLDDVISWDLHLAGAVRRHGDLVLLREGDSFDQSFVFIAPDRLLTADKAWCKHGVGKARLAAFPSGKEIARPELPEGRLFRAADPAWVIVRPFEPPLEPPPGLAHGSVLWQFSIGRQVPLPGQAMAAQIGTGQVIKSEAPALDVYHNYYIAESSQGEVGLYERGKGLQAKIALHEKGSQ